MRPTGLSSLCSCRVIGEVQPCIIPPSREPMETIALEITCFAIPAFLPVDRTVPSGDFILEKRRFSKSPATRHFYNTLPPGTDCYLELPNFLYGVLPHSRSSLSVVVGEYSSDIYDILNA
uniref:Uncharacterized protein n=1 Tax=Lygus hesperus TaxID=30085 RepID=A0A146L4S3_LYGHE